MVIIPKELYAGFVIRYNHHQEIDYKLAFLVEYDDTENSRNRINAVGKWERDKNYLNKNKEPIPSEIYTNDLISGFKVTNPIKRGSWRDSTIVWQITDPRGFDFQITSNNMAYILDTCTIVNGVIQEKCIIGIDRSVLLLPENSQPYKDAVVNTDIYNKDAIPIKDLKPGDVFQTKGKWGGTFIGRYHYAGFNSLQLTVDCSRVKKNFYYDEYHKYYKNLSSDQIYEITGSDLQKVKKFEKNPACWCGNIDVKYVSDKPIKIQSCEMKRNDSLNRNKSHIVKKDFSYYFFYNGWNVYEIFFNDSGFYFGSQIYSDLTKKQLLECTELYELVVNLTNGDSFKV